jgi:hypothetical protein
VIIRIMGEGQFEVDDTHLAELNRLDDALGEAMEGDDDGAFRAALGALLDEVRRAGTPVADDALVDSDLVLPYDEAHVDEVRELLTDEGLVPSEPPVK